MSPLVLLTGSTGYIASHTWLELLSAGFRVVGVDNFSNSSPVVLDRIAELSGQAPVFHRVDVCDQTSLEAVFQQHRFDAVVHFAAFKAVGESHANALAYYTNNLGGLLSLCQAMNRSDCRTLVFSSSATVYGKPESLPVSEGAALSSTNPYGATKLMGENILRDIMAADPRWTVALLRYFNPVGAHTSGLIGESPQGVPNNLMPYVSQVAAGTREKLRVFGRDYDTPDGTGVRDYIHVLDLAGGHVAALRYLLDQRQSLTLNLGTGQGHSVLEVVNAFERVTGRRIPVEFAPRRSGDVASCYADTRLAREILGWQASRTLDEMCADSWRWQQLNPSGFTGEPV